MTTQMKTKDAGVKALTEKSNQTATEIADYLKNNNIEMISKGKTPESTLAAMLGAYCSNSNRKQKNKKPLFEITDRNPIRYSLIKKQTPQTNAEIAKYLIDNNVYCLKIEDVDGNELEGVYIENEKSWFMKTTNKSADKNKLFLNMFVKLLQQK